MEIESIYRQFRLELFHYIKSKVRTHEDAEDILHNVFIKIAANIGTLAEEERLKSWLFTVTRNSIIDYYRSNSRKPLVVTSDDMNIEVMLENDVDSTKGLDQCMGRLIALLPSEYRDIIVDSEIKEIKQKDLATKYSMAYPSMRSRVQRGRERLKQLFQDCCHITTDTRGNVLEAHSRKGCEGPCGE
jgi:RNA polymerase sigma-70 factor, ECF subfamily